MKNKSTKNIDTNILTLKFFSAMLQDCEHFVFFGTMLGLVRDGHPIENDDDVDFYVNKKDRSKVLNILKNLKIKRVIFFSSVDEVGFSNKNINENTNYSPSNKYSIIKLLARELFEEFCIKYSKPYTIFRLFLVIGNNQKIPRLFPLIKYHIQNGKKFVINNPLAYKNFIHIDDFCNVLDIILKNKMSLNNIYNLASDQNIKLEKLFKLIHNINPLLKFEKNLNGSLNSQKASIFKIKKIIGNYKFKNINQIIKSFEF